MRLWPAKRLAPLTHEGRQTLVYLIFAGSGPVLTCVVIWGMQQSLDRKELWSTFTGLSYIVAASLLIIVTALGMFVSIRAVKLTKTGFEATGGGEPEAAQAVADVAQVKADEIKEAVSG
jgi:hypothetical protein